MVTRDPEFDDTELQNFLGLLEYERGICDCGIHESVAGNQDNYFTFDLRTCQVCKGVAQYGRVLAAEDKAQEDALKDAPPAFQRPGDGRRVLVRQMSQMEVQARRSR